MITSDSHMHTIFSEDCEIPVRAMVEGAIQKGLSSVCITDHDDYGFEDEDIGALKDPDGYVKTVLELREEYRGIIDVRLGIELGVQPQFREHFREITEKYPFDFVVASAHIIDGFDPYLGQLYDSMSDEDVMKRTFCYIAECMNDIPDFDVIGHMDYVARYAPGGTLQYSCDRMMDEIDVVLKKVIEMGKGIEINTSGIKYLGFCHPHIDILKRYRELGGEIITIGSDAHKPEAIASDFKAAEAVLRDCGYDFYAEFYKRKPVFKKLY